MRVVITGGTGNVGTSLIQALEHEAAVSEVVGIARREPEWRPAKTTWAEADVAEDPLDNLFAGAQAVVHLAWLFQPTHDPITTWNANVLGSIRVFEAAARARVDTLVYASSVGAYSPGPSDGSPVDESWPTNALPTSAYGREKSYVERVLDTFERDHPQLRVVRLRPGFIFKRQSATEQRRLFAGPLVPGRLIRPELLPVTPDFDGFRFQMLHATDAASAYRLALTRDVRGPFNIAADPVIDAAVVAGLFHARTVRMPRAAIRLAMAAAWQLRLAPAEPALLDLAASLPVMDTTRARTELGWQPSRTSIDAITEFLDGLRAGAGADTPPLEPDSLAARASELRAPVGTTDRA
jgi:UDP-glucose 4-epimerase